MKILDVIGFDQIPAGSSIAPATDTTVPGTRLRTLSIGYIGTTNSPAVLKGADNTLRMTATGGLVSGFGGHQLASASAIYLADVAPEVLGKDTTITIGYRVVLAGGSNLNVSVLRLGSLLFTNSSVAGPNWPRSIVSADLPSNPAVGVPLYLEIVVNRKTGLAKVYLENVFLKSIDFSSDLLTGEFMGFNLPFYGATANYGGGSGSLNYRDIYLAEVEEGDACDRLGPQVVKSLPVASVNAAWTANVAAAGVVGSLNDAHPNISAVPAAASLTTVAVTDNDPNGLVNFSTENLADTDRIAAVVYQVDALAPSGSSTLESKLLNGSTTEETKSLVFTQAYNRGLVPGQSNWAKKAHLRQFPALAGSKTAVGNLKLKLRASA